MDAYEDIPEQRCRELLSSDSVGRIEFSTPAGPRLVPVSYRTHDSTLSFRTAEFSELATYAPGAEVCLEIEHHEAGHRRWRVRACGTCHRAATATDDPAEHDEAWLSGFQGLGVAWDLGDQSVLLTLDWTDLTGQQMAAS